MHSQLKLWNVIAFYFRHSSICGMFYERSDIIPSGNQFVWQQKGISLPILLEHPAIILSSLSASIPHASPKHSDSISAALEEFLQALQQHPDSLVKAFAQAFREHSADILTGMLVWSMKVYCATALLDLATRKPSNHIKMHKFVFECIWRVRVYLAAFVSLHFIVF